LDKIFSAPKPLPTSTAWHHKVSAISRGKKADPKGVTDADLQELRKVVLDDTSPSGASLSGAASDAGPAPAPAPPHEQRMLRREPRGGQREEEQAACGTRVHRAANYCRRRGASGCAVSGQERDG